MLAGAVRMVFTSVILRAGSFLSAAGAGVCGAAAASQGKPSVPAPAPVHFSQSLRCMRELLGVRGRDGERSLTAKRGGGGLSSAFPAGAWRDFCYFIPMEDGNGVGLNPWNSA